MSAYKKLIVFTSVTSLFLFSSAYAGQDGSQSYVLATGQGAIKRLEVSELAYGKATKSLFQELELSADLNILIMACGTGEQLPWLAHLVGPKGHVTCADISEMQLQAAKSKGGDLKNVSFLNLDLLDTPHISSVASQGKFDVVMSRFVLVHLKDPKTAVKNMLSLVKKGGYLICEEHDVSRIDSYPSNPSIHIAKDYLDRLAIFRQVDFNYGTKLLSLFHNIGLNSAKIALSTPAFNLGIEKHLLEMSLQEGKSAYIDAKIATEPEMKKLIEGIKVFTDDPSTWISLGGFFQVFVRVE